MESKDKEKLTDPSAGEPLFFKELNEKLEKLKEIDIFGIEPLLPPTWKEGRF